MKTHLLKRLPIKTLLIVQLPLLLTGCESWFEKKQHQPKPQPEPQLPPETQEGKHTLGCLVNGGIWLPDDSPRPGSIGGISANYDGDYFNVNAIAKTKDAGEQDIAITIKQGVTQPGVYQLNNPREQIVLFVDTNTKCLYGWDSIKQPQIGELEITKIDTKKYFVSGRFWFTLVQPGCDTIRVTDGRFDVKYGW
jgi:hypothetical protein